MLNGWRQVPDILIFFSSKKKRYIKVSNIPDAGVSFVELSLPETISGGYTFGSIATQRISPIYINLNKKPVGQNATLIRAQYRSVPDWEKGTIEVAIDYAYAYMKKHSGVD